LLVGHFLVLDVSSDHFLIAADGRDKVSASTEFVAQGISHLSFDCSEASARLARIIPNQTGTSNNTMMAAGALKIWHAPRHPSRQPPSRCLDHGREPV